MDHGKFVTKNKEGALLLSSPFSHNLHRIFVSSVADPAIPTPRVSSTNLLVMSINFLPDVINHILEL